MENKTCRPADAKNFVYVPLGEHVQKNACHCSSNIKSTKSISVPRDVNLIHHWQNLSRHLKTTILGHVSKNAACDTIAKTNENEYQWSPRLKSAKDIEER